MDRSFCVVFALVADVFEHPWKVARSEADDTVAALPFERRAKFVGARSFKLPDQFVKVNLRRGRKADVQMIFDAPDPVEVRSVGGDDLVLDETIKQRFQ